MNKLADAKELYLEFQKIRLNLDRVNTPNLSRIKEIIKRIHFADITTKQQVLDNKGNAFFKIRESDEGDTYINATLSYTVFPSKTGVVYGVFSEEEKDGNTKVLFSSKGKANQFNNYARFLVDIISKKVIYSKELERFVIVQPNTFQVLDELTFQQEYPIDKSSQIIDFLNVIEEIYKNVIKVKTHDFIVYPYTFAGNDWVYDCEHLEFIPIEPKENELFVSFYDVSKNEINLRKVNEFIDVVADDSKSANNIRLLHAYIYYRKLKLVFPEYFFILKDFGRTGKGLFMQTFENLLKVHNVSTDNFKNGGFEANNEWLNFYGCELALANESGEITPDMMRYFRKIATGETVTGRGIGKDGFSFKIESVLVLDTNEAVDVGSITANKSRTVKISFNDVMELSDQERHEKFKPWWEFFAPKGKQSLSASVSTLINSLNYLKEKEGKFIFDEVSLKNYYSADQFTETQRIIIVVIDGQGFILSGDETLQKAIEEDYGSLRTKKARDDVKKIGVKLNKPKRIGGNIMKVHVVEDEGLFKHALSLIEKNSID